MPIRLRLSNIPIAWRISGGFALLLVLLGTMAWGSDRDAAAPIKDIFGVDAVALELVDARFYHLDTALCPLSGGEFMFVPAAFTRQGLAQIPSRNTTSIGQPTYFWARGTRAANAASGARSSIPSSRNPARTAAITNSPTWCG